MLRGERPERKGNFGVAKPFGGPPGIPAESVHNVSRPHAVLRVSRCCGPHRLTLHISNAPMAKQRSAYQDKIIRNYYEHHDDIMLQRLGELVTDLFLAEGQAKVRLWKRVATTLEKLNIPKDQITHLVEADNPTLVANLLKKLLDASA